MFKLLHALAVTALIALPSAQVAALPSATNAEAAATTHGADAPAASISLTRWHEGDMLSAVVTDEAELQGDEEEPPADSYTVSRALGESLALHADIAHQVAPDAVWIAPHVSSGAPRGPPER